MSSMCMALVMKCVASYSQKTLWQGSISRLYSSKRRFTRPSLLTRRSALVLKWVCRTGGNWQDASPVIAKED